MAAFVGPHLVPLPRTSPLNPSRSLSSAAHGRLLGRPVRGPSLLDPARDGMVAAAPLGLPSAIAGDSGSGSGSRSGRGSTTRGRPRKPPSGPPPTSMAAAPAQEDPLGGGRGGLAAQAAPDAAAARRASRRAVRATASAAAVAAATAPAVATTGGRSGRASAAPAATTSASSLRRARGGGKLGPRVGGRSLDEGGDSADDDEWVEDEWPLAAAGGPLPSLTADGVLAVAEVAAPPLQRVRSADYLPASADEFPFNVGELTFEGDENAVAVPPHPSGVDAGLAAAASRRTAEGNGDGPGPKRRRPSSVSGRVPSARRPPSASDPPPHNDGGAVDVPPSPAKLSSEDDSLVDADGHPLPDHHIRRRLSPTWRYKLRYARELMASGVAGPARGGLENLRPYVAAAAAVRACTPCDGTGMAVCSYCKGAGFVRLGGRPGARVFSITHNQSMAVLPTHVMGDTFHCPLCGGLRRERCVRCAGSVHIRCRR